MGQHKQLSMNCRQCGREFWTRATYIRSGTRRFCSNKCAQQGPNNGNYKASTKTDYQRIKESIARHPQKHACRAKFYAERKLGLIERAPCIFCGRQKVEGHHWDYAKPYDVFWLCRQHHVDVHKRRITLLLPADPVIPAV